MATLLDPVRNLAKATVSTGYDASATSIALTTGHGARFPDVTTEGAFNVIWWNSTDYPDPSDDPNVEIVRVTARSTDTLTVTRAQEGTAASSKNLVGKTYRMIVGFTKKAYDDFNTRKESFYPRQDFLPHWETGLYGGSLLTYFPSGHGWVVGANGTQSDDTSDFIRGTQSLKMVTPGGNQVCQSSKTSISPTLDLTDKQLVIQMKVTNIADLSEMSLYLSSDGLTSNFRVFNIVTPLSGATYKQFQEGQWVTIILRLENGSDTGTPNMAAIDSMRLRYRDDGTGSVTVNTNLIGFIPLPTEGVVSFTFDDGYADQYTAARPILDKYGYAATAYIIPSVVDTAGQMTTTQLNNLYNLNGWDIATQGADLNLTTRTAAQIEQDFIEAKQFLREKGWHRAADHYAYPQGAFDYTNIIPLIKKYWTTARTIIAGESDTNIYANSVPPDQYFTLRAYDIRNTTTISNVTNAIQRAKERREWLILNFHHIVTPADDLIEVTPTNFETIVAACRTNNIRVLPVSEVIRTLHHIHYF